MDLSQTKHLDLKDADVSYYPAFFCVKDADLYFKNLLKALPWQQDKIKVFGTVYDQPRLTAFFGNNAIAYTYSSITMHPNPFEGDLLTIKQSIENVLNVTFTSCLANLYRTGKDSNGWHADNEKVLGKHPIIASVTFGEERPFHLKHRKDKTLKEKLILQHGSLLVMQGATQEHWLHQIPKTKKDIGPRINLTFRILPDR